jgi:hypothetical protein
MKNSIFLQWEGPAPQSQILMNYINFIFVFSAIASTITTTDVQYIATKQTVRHTPYVKNTRYL